MKRNKDKWITVKETSYELKREKRNNQMKRRMDEKIMEVFVALQLVQMLSNLKQNVRKQSTHRRKGCNVRFLSKGGNGFFKTFNQSHIKVHYKPLREVSLCGPENDYVV